MRSWGSAFPGVENTKPAGVAGFAVGIFAVLISSCELLTMSDP